MTNHETIYCFRISTKRSWRNLVKLANRNLNCIRFYLTRAKNGISMVITHEQWLLASFLRLYILELKLVQFSWILELWIIIYELITNYTRLIIELELIIKQNYFIILFQRLSLNSNYRIEIILLLNLVKLLQISDQIW
jgi:hypothetical protein